MEPESSLLYSQEPATGSYPDESSPHLPLLISLTSILILSFIYI
jgi:hypothetical protein